MLVVGFLVKRVGKGVTAFLVIAVVLIMGCGSLISSFEAFSGKALVATVQAVSVQGQSHEMIVHLSTYDSWGDTTEKTYEIGGDLWMLQCQTIEAQGWLNFFGIHAGYHLQRLSGEYSGSLLGSKPILLGSWSFFNWLEENVQVFFPVVRSAYSSAVIDPPGTYNIYVDNSGDLSAERA